MKQTNLAIVLAALTVSAGFALAQDDAVLREHIPVPPPPEVPVGGGGGQSRADAEVQSTTSEDRMLQAERALATNQKAMMYAQARAGEAERTFTKTLTRGGYRNGSAGRALIIPNDAGDAKSIGEAEEDLNVMAHILDKAISDDGNSARAMGIPVFGRVPGLGASPQNLYLEGYGAVFFENVNYPLLPPPTQPDDGNAKEKPNSEWEEARKEMSRPGSGGGADAFAGYGDFEREFVWNGGGPSPYDAGKVEALKSNLIAALKNAANIRQLKLDEVVTVVVTGATADVGGKTIKSTGNKPQPKDDIFAVRVQALWLPPSHAPGKLVLRTRKSDAEAFQNGKLSADEFKKKVTVMVY